jgi:hypothetical protein
VFARSSRGRTLERETDNDDENDDGNELRDRDDPVDGRSLADSPCDQVMEEPHTRRGQPNSQDRVAFSQSRKESSQCCHGEDQEKHIPCDVARPVTERGVEACKVPEPCLGVDVHATIKIGPTHSQRLKDESEHEHPRARDDPGDDGAEHTGRRAETPGKRKDATTDHGADDDPYERKGRDLLWRLALSRPRRAPPCTARKPPLSQAKMATTSVMRCDSVGYCKRPCQLRRNAKTAKTRRC